MKRRRSYISNPAWVDRLLTKHWQAIEAAVGKKRMPVESRGVMEEYGCGAYGCVLPTHDAGIVLKITTDASEAAFASAAMQIAKKERRGTLGIVSYYVVVGLPETYNGKSVYLLWREEAQHVGALLPLATRRGLRDYNSLRGRAAEYSELYSDSELDEFVSSLEEFLRRANDVFDAVDATHDRQRASLLSGVRSVRMRSGSREKLSASAIEERATTIAELLEELETIAHGMRSLPFGDDIGIALEYYLQRGIVLADVHLGNVGEVGSTKNEVRLAITDPGMMVPVDPAWLAVDIAMVA